MEPEITVIIIDDDLGSIQKIAKTIYWPFGKGDIDTATTAELGQEAYP